MGRETLAARWADLPGCLVIEGARVMEDGLIGIGSQGSFRGPLPLPEQYRVVPALRQDELRLKRGRGRVPRARCSRAASEIEGAVRLARLGREGT